MTISNAARMQQKPYDKISALAVNHYGDAVISTRGPDCLFPSQSHGQRSVFSRVKCGDS